MKMADAKTLAQTITGHIKIKRWKEMVWRMKIAMALIGLATWISWCNIEVEMEDENERI